MVLPAHADQVSFSTRIITKHGTLAISPLIPSQKGNLLENGSVCGVSQPAAGACENWPGEGVLTAVTGHVTTYEQERPQGGLRGLARFLGRVGCSSFEELRRWVSHKDAHCMILTIRRLRNGIVGKAMKDRAGLAKIDREALGCELWLAGTVMEECYALGAWALAPRFLFDLAIIVNIGLSCDGPSASEAMSLFAWVMGPCWLSRTAPHAIELLRRLERCALENGISGRRAIYGVGGSCTSDGLCFVGHRITTGILTFPTAYTHSQYDVVDEQGLEAVARLLCRGVLKVL